MTDSLPREPYRPSNGTEGACFIDSWCCRCARDKVMNGTATDEDADKDPSLYCPILTATMADGGAPEWQHDEKGEPCCTGFVDMVDAVPGARCEHTIELPLEPLPAGVQPQGNGGTK